MLTLEWIDGVPISDHETLRAQGHDLKALGARLMRTFLRHAMRDGFFHADMHQGNLFVDASGRIVAVDFGIMGRLGMKERRFLAEILLGFITRNYQRTAEVHFEAGYVPPHHSVASFAQAIRAIGEPIHSRAADEISMAKLFCGRMSRYVADECMQLHGGLGLTTDLPIHKMWKDSRSFMITEGAVEVMRTVLAREIFKMYT